MADVEAEFARRVDRAARAGPLMGSHARERIVRGVLEAAGVRQLLEEREQLKETVESLERRERP